jgi:mono/diheme cytochrome c family protein
MVIVWKGLMYKYWFAAAALAAAVAIGALLLMTGSYNPFGTSAGTAAQIAKGQTLYGVRCASCHGKNLEGQPNWQTPLPNGRLPAPPHDKTGHTWHHADKALAGITKLGLKPFAGDNYESDMPAFGTILSDEEIEAILVYIKSTWPEREQAYQRQITQQANQQ